MLTRHDIKALRMADYIAFAATADASSITAIIRASDKNPFEMKREIGVAHSFRSFSAHEESMSYARHDMLHPELNDHWQSITSLMREGDNLTLSWGADAATTLALRDAGFHGDVLRIRITRGDDVRFSFDLATSVCEANTARMIHTRKDAATSEAKNEEAA